MVVIDLATDVQFCCSEKEQAGQISLGQTKLDPPEFERKHELRLIRPPWSPYRKGNWATFWLSDGFARLPALLRCLWGSPGKRRIWGVPASKSRCFAWVPQFVRPLRHGLFSVNPRLKASKAFLRGELRFLFSSCGFQTSPVDRVKETSAAVRCSKLCANRIAWTKKPGGEGRRPVDSSRVWCQN